MKIIPASDFVSMPWKNGGGVTHEILKQEHEGRLLFRLSIAHVESDGPFSSFPGLSRILTVIEGDGLTLHAADHELIALPLKPVAFSGDLGITSTRISGHVRDFNVIFDAKRVEASVTVVTAGQPLALTARDKIHHAILMLGASYVDGEPVKAGSLIWLDNGAAHITSKSHLLWTRIQHI